MDLIGVKLVLFSFLFNMKVGKAIDLRFGLVADPVSLNVTIRRASPYTIIKKSLLGCFDECVRWQKWPPCQGVLLKDDGTCELVSVTDQYGQPFQEGQGQLYVRDCPDGYIAHGGWECYKLVDASSNRKDWWQIWALCRQDGAVMVAMETPEKQQRVASMLNHYGVTTTWIHTSGNDITTTGKRKWGIEDQERDADYIAFYTYQPGNLGTEHCYTMYRGVNWKLYDRPCGAITSYYICEI